jgi:hypothetical protein
LEKGDEVMWKTARHRIGEELVGISVCSGRKVEGDDVIGEGQPTAIMAKEILGEGRRRSERGK